MRHSASRDSQLVVPFEQERRRSDGPPGRGGELLEGRTGPSVGGGGCCQVGQPWTCCHVELASCHLERSSETCAEHRAGKLHRLRRLFRIRPSHGAVVGVHDSMAIAYEAAYISAAVPRPFRFPLLRLEVRKERIDPRLGTLEAYDMARLKLGRQQVPFPVSVGDWITVNMADNTSPRRSSVQIPYFDARAVEIVYRPRPLLYLVYGLLPESVEVGPLA